jgi:hypothetical protein
MGSCSGTPLHHRAAFNISCSTTGPSASAGTLPTHGPLFVLLLLAAVLLVGLLNYVPALTGRRCFAARLPAIASTATITP